MPPEEYVPTFVKVKCNCNKFVNVRTAQEIKIVSCWNCGMPITVILGYGRGNLRVYVGTTHVRPVDVIQ